MTASSRDRISIDLRGLKSTLLERSQARGMTPSNFVRSVLAAELRSELRGAPVVATHLGACEPRTRLSLRMQRREVRLIVQLAREAGLTPGAYVAGLCCGVRVLLNGQRPADHAAALVRSCAELSTLARDLRHLTLLLRQGEVRAAQEYRERLGNTERDVRAHLALAAAVMAELQPLGPSLACVVQREGVTHEQWIRC